MNFATTQFTPRSCVKISDSFWNPRSASSSHTISHWSLIAARTRSEYGSLSTDSQPSLKHLCHTFIHAVLTALSLKAFWIIQIGMFKLNAKFDADHCSACSVILNATATQCTCSVNGVYHPTDEYSEVVTVHAYSSPLSLAARLHQCCTNHSHYINNSWEFFQTDLVHI